VRGGSVVEDRQIELAESGRVGDPVDSSDLYPWHMLADDAGVTATGMAGTSA
jgi:hypothetical protein